MDRFVLGIDGGGTNTRAALVAGSGHVLGLGIAGPSNPRVVGDDAARVQIREAIDLARQKAQLPDEAMPSAAFFGVAGVVSNTDRQELRAIASDLVPGAHVHVDHDLRIALAGALLGSPGIVLIAGTGSSCYGRTVDGSEWRSGGWGPLLDDLGSAYWLGLEALVAITRAADGRGPATSMIDPLLSQLGVEHVLDLLRFGSDTDDRRRIAALAPLVLDAEESGDEIAHEIVRRGAEELARMVQAVAQRLGWITGSVPLVFSGGLAVRQAYRSGLELLLERRAPQVALVDAAAPPVIGAALLALESLGPISHHVRDALAQG